MIKVFTILVSFFVLTLTAIFTVVPAQAETPIKLSAKGDVAEVSLDAARVQSIVGSSQPFIDFVLETKGNISTLADLYVEAPVGAKVSAHILQNASAAQAVARLGGAVPLRILGKKGSKTSITLTKNMSASVGRRSAAVALAAEECPGADPAYLSLLVQKLGSVLPFSFICRMAQAGNPSPNPQGNPGPNSPNNPPVSGDNAQLNTTAELHRNTCSKVNAYLVRVRVDLSGAADTALNSGAVLKASLREKKYSGSKAASIKPKSDGMYRNEPILLMSSVGGSEYFNVYSWTGEKSSGQKLAVAKYAYYRGLSLALGRLKGLLNGQQATFELTNDYSMYSVCFRRTASRQAVNGYPSPQ